ncbi:MFS multidrug-resistance DHA1 sub-family [Suillus spraguei]|nr:MFS multidrug-resistance DHA1 sub-family [Suillus spraguei]
MITQEDDEEAFLLHRPLEEQPTTKTPLPWDQFWIILFLQVSEPLSSHTIAPFIPQLIRDIGVTHGDESQVGHYVGILESSYYAAHVLTVLYWSQLSDRIGRKPVILIALLVISVSMFSFGLSKTFLGLVVSRAVCGAFDGSNPVIKSMVIDITDVTNMPKAYGYIPIPWMIGHTAGPLIGGSFSRPADRFPDIFGRSELLKTYPYFLPCSISTIFISLAWLVTYFRLKESVSARTPLWELIKGGLFRQSYAKPRQSSSNVLVNPREGNSEEVRSKSLPLLLVVVANHAATNLLNMSFTSVLPLFYATSIEHGGLSLEPPRIGAILAAQGAAHGISQLLFYARLHDHFGLVVWLCVAIQLALTINLNMCNTCLALFVRAAAPNHASLGATNGITQTFVSGAKIIGPASAASIFSYSLQEGHDAWLVYYFLMALAFLAVGVSLLFPRDLSVWEDDQ